MLATFVSEDRLFGANSQCGATLLELMAALVVLSTLVMLSLPSFNSMFSKAQLRTASESVLNGMNFARAQAIHQNTRIRYTLSSDGNWLVDDESGNKLMSRNAQGEDTANVLPFIYLSSGGKVDTGILTFNGLGRVVANTDGSASIQKVLVSVPGIKDTLQVEVGNKSGVSGGQVRGCDPTVTDSSDPRFCVL